MIGSSCVGAKPSVPPPTTSVLNQMSTSWSENRPVFSHNSGFWRDDKSTSCPPIAFNSSRMMLLIFSITRSPSGKKSYTPANSLWMYPARVRSAPFCAISSFGASLKVLIKVCVIFMTLIIPHLRKILYTTIISHFTKKVNGYP